MITASTYTLVVVPALIIALCVGAVLWSNASGRQFDQLRPAHPTEAAVVLPDLNPGPLSDEEAFSLGPDATKSALGKRFYGGSEPLTTTLRTGTRLSGQLKPDLGTAGVITPKRSEESA